MHLATQKPDLRGVILRMPDGYHTERREDADSLILYVPPDPETQPLLADHRLLPWLCFLVSGFFFGLLILISRLW